MKTEIIMRNRLILLGVIVAIVAGVIFLRLGGDISGDDGGEYRVEITQWRGYKGVVSVYDESGEAAFRWFSADEHIIKAAISPRTESMSVLTLSGAGCKRRVFNLYGDGGERGHYISTDCLFFDVGYLSENRIYTIGGDRSVIFDSAGEEISAYTYPDEYLTEYGVSRSVLTLTLNEYQAGGTARAVSYDGSDWNVNAAPEPS
jgi:hypothetical protein